jgi:hypothetical protein
VAIRQQQRELVLIPRSPRFFKATKKGEYKYRGKKSKNGNKRAKCIVFKSL